MSSTSSISSNTAIEHKETYIGRTPENELHINPRWLIFDGSDGYRRPQVGTVKLTNLDDEPVFFRLRGRDRAVMLCSVGYGIIQPKCTAEITVVVPPHDQWPRDPNDFAGRRVRIVAENLLFPLGLVKIPDTQNRIDIVGRKIFHTTASNAPMTRVYTKINLLLPKIPDDWTMIEMNTPTASSSKSPT